MHRPQLDNSLIGAVIGDSIEIKELLGSGAMGTTYRGWQPDLKRHVCVKLLKRDGVSNVEDIERFRREARVLAGLRHKNIVTCYSFGIYEHVFPFLVLELVQGVTLSSLLEPSQGINWKRACLLTSRICDGLSYAHQQGFVHRDIKPENIMVEQDGSDQIKIIDFGLVGKNKQLPGLNTLTDAGTLLGTVNYMAPEAFKGSTSDKALDIYALGCVLHQLLSGQLPFDADNPMSVMFKHTTESLPELPASVAPTTVRKALDSLIWNMTDQDPVSRPDCSATAEILRTLAESEQADTRPWEIGPPRRILSCALICVVAVAMVAFTVYLGRQKKESRQLYLVTSTMPSGSAPTSTQLETIAELSERLIQELETEKRPAPKGTISSVLAEGQKFVITRGIELDSADRKTIMAGERLIRHLTTIYGIVSRKHSHLGHKLPPLLGLQAELVACFGCYRATKSLMSSGVPLPVTFEISRGDEDDLTELARFGIGLLQEAKTPRMHAAAVIRPLIPRLSVLSNGEDYLIAYIMALEGAAQQGAPWKDLWQPSLLSTVTKAHFNNENNKIRTFSMLANYYLLTGDRESARSTVDRMLSASSVELIPRQDNFGMLAAKCGRWEKAAVLLKAAAKRSLRRQDPAAYCSSTAALSTVYLYAKQPEEAVKVVEQLLACPQWKTLMSHWRSNTCPPDYLDAIHSCCSILLNNRVTATNAGFRKCAGFFVDKLEGILTAGVVDDQEYRMAIYFILRYYSEAEELEKSLPLARYYASIYKTCSDDFFKYASMYELAMRLSACDKNAEAKRLAPKALKLADKLIQGCDVAGGYGYIFHSSPLWEQLGFPEHARRIRQGADKQLKP